MPYESNETAAQCRQRILRAEAKAAGMPSRRRKRYLYLLRIETTALLTREEAAGLVAHGGAATQRAREKRYTEAMNATCGPSQRRKV